MYEIPAQAEPEYFSHIVPATLHVNILRTFLLTTLANVQHLTIMPPFLKFVLDKLHAYSPAGTGRRIGTNFEHPSLVGVAHEDYIPSEF
jgi:hypothetical protein